ncbi:MAG: putative lipid II flippase FtsW [bacterium]|nr:putative lipid II flippase FtsW [bacterium]
MRIRDYDQIFFMLTSAIIIFGLFILASASLFVSADRFGQSYYYLFHQIIFGLVPGLILFYLALRIPYKYLRSYALPLLLVGIFMMFLVFVPKIGVYHGGAQRWIALGSITFQPSEFLKFAFIVYLSAWFETKTKELKSFKFGLLPFAIMTGFIASFLVMQPDIGTLGVLIVSIFALYFLSGGAMKQLGVLAGVGAVILALLILIEPYRMERLTTFLSPETNIQGSGYQINQALIATGSGGLFGRGFGMSRQKFSYLPEPIGDSIFAIFAEEMGFLGSIALLTLFLLFFVRGIKITKTAPDSFGKYLGAGLLFLIVFQAIINISAIIGLMPLTGIPLSFVSYGGSAMMITLMEVGVIFNISKQKT